MIRRPFKVVALEHKYPAHMSRSIFGSLSSAPRANPTPAERVAPTSRSPWWGEHRSRYRFACRYVERKEVLDVAHGTGFGGSILTRCDAAWVYGIDIQLESVQRQPRVSLCQADGTRLPFRDCSFDVVTSFETVEHVAEDGLFVSELKRVLRLDGTLLISTPNSLQSPKLSQGTPANPFHVREYAPDELHRLLQTAFTEVTLLGQRTSARYPVSPFWERSDLIAHDRRKQLAAISWKLQNRLPYSIKESLSQLFHGRSFFPGEGDFEFEEDHIQEGHVLVAVCRHPRHAPLS